MTGETWVLPNCAPTFNISTDIDDCRRISLRLFRGDVRINWQLHLIIFVDCETAVLGRPFTLNTHRIFMSLQWKWSNFLSIMFKITINLATENTVRLKFLFIRFCWKWNWKRKMSDWNKTENMKIELTRAYRAHMIKYINFVSLLYLYDDASGLTSLSTRAMKLFFPTPKRISIEIYFRAHGCRIWLQSLHFWWTKWRYGKLLWNISILDGFSFLHSLSFFAYWISFRINSTFTGLWYTLLLQHKNPTMGTTWSIRKFTWCSWRTFGMHCWTQNVHIRWFRRDDGSIFMRCSLLELKNDAVVVCLHVRLFQLMTSSLIVVHQPYLSSLFSLFSLSPHSVQIPLHRFETFILHLW